MPQTISALLLTLGLTALTAAGAGPAKAADEKNPGCKIVELKAGEQPPSGTMSSTVTAGGGTVTGSTTGGNSVSAQSRNGSTMSTVTTGSSSDGKSTTTMMSSNGECTIYKQSK